MSRLSDLDPVPGDPKSCSQIEHVIVPRARDLGGFQVRRVLPSAQKQMVGPFIFFDQMGPVEFVTSQGIDVRPHPHIGLATVTYLFQGEMWHRDSLGTSVVIRPGDVNLMTAGSGIVHSERETPEAKARTREMFGIQAWMALPKSHEDTAPAFAHHGVGDLPRIAGEDKRVRLVMGEGWGARSPVEFAHPALYAEAVLAPGAVLPIDPDYDERAVYVASGEIDITGETFEAGRLLVLRPGDRVSVLAVSQARIMVLGGEAMDGPRHIWWNFVASSKDRIEAAKADWMASRSGIAQAAQETARFPLVPTDETDFIPAPA
jgi:redox-sensitive bicupin YhaK (pirin superfamily)